jgi:uncharacterized RDD family membrane protein YckC
MHPKNKMPTNIAAVGKRSWGGLIDLLLSFVFVVLLGLVFGDTYVGGSQTGGFSFRVTGPSFYAGSVLSILISAYLEFKYGKTPGKFICKIRVVAEADGSPITLKQSMIRNFLRFIDGIVLYLVGFIVMVIDKNNQRLGDLTARTVVIDEHVFW